MELVRVALLVVSTITMGLVAGLFYGFACSVMVTLRRTDDRTFVNVMQRINRDIENGWFALSFVGSVLFTAISLVLFIAAGKGTVVVPLIVGLACYIVNMIITFGINIPMNKELDAAGHPDKIGDIGVVRKKFEARWNVWNTNRALACIAAFGALCWALIAYGSAM